MEAFKPLTAEEARAAELPSFLHPIRRLGKLAEYGSRFPQPVNEPAFIFVRRSGLVRIAEIFDQARELGDSTAEIEAIGLDNLGGM